MDKIDNQNNYILHRAHLFIAALGGIFLISAGLIEFIPSIILKRDQGTILGIQLLEPIPRGDITQLIADEELSVTIRNNPTDWSNLGLARIIALDSNNDAGGLVKAREALVESLKLAPANPYVWARLTLIDELQMAPQATILRDWRMSILTGSNEERLRPLQIRLAIDLWPYLTSADRMTVYSQIRATWSYAPATILDIAIAPFQANIIRAGLVTNLEDLSQFEKHYLRINKEKSGH
jgi:hypothetical protein